MPKFRVLALDGGGIRGAFGASVLAELESILDRPVHEYFDLVVGTSTGGIIAMGLALGMSAAEVRDFYAERGEAIFSRRQPGSWWGWRKPKYAANHLEAALVSAFGDRRIADAKVRLVIPAVNLTTGTTTTFKTPHLKAAATRDLNCAAADVVMATTAAPTFFPHARVNGDGAYCDGGLWANNPSLVGYTEAIRIRDQLIDQQAPVCFSERDIAVLSIGTGRLPRSLDPPQTAGLKWWAPRLVDMLLTAQAQGTEFVAQFLMSRGTYHRIDFDLPDRSWTLDNTTYLGQYLHRGKQEAHVHAAALKEAFFTAPACSFDSSAPHDWQAASIAYSRGTPSSRPA